MRWLVGLQRFGLVHDHVDGREHEVVIGHGSTTGSTIGAIDNATCVLAPEMTEGPFYLDINKVRSDITEGRPGAPLGLALTVVDASTCAPVSGAAVDIWHTDASGDYSGVNGNSGTFMRGTQVSGSDGVVTFKTLYPGWYTGRAVHIHVKVHAGGNVVHTGQLFFPDAFTSSVYKRSPYSSRPGPDLTQRTGQHLPRRWYAVDAQPDRERRRLRRRHEARRAPHLIPP